MDLKGLADGAAVMAAGAAVVALFIAAWQVSESRKSASETTALQAYREYIALCIDKPHLSSWILFSN